MQQLPPVLTAYLIFVTFVTGLVFGSFCNAWAWRLSHGGAITKGRSHCPKCDHILSPLDLIPLFSYLFLRGRCRYCKEPIARRYPATELICGIFFVSVMITFMADHPLTLIRWIMVGCLLLTLSLVDLETFEIRNRLLLGIALAFFMFVPITEGVSGLIHGLIGGAGIFIPLLLLVLAADKLMGKETMGGGDLKLFAVLGLHFGIWNMLLLLFVSCLFGICFSVFYHKNSGPEDSKEFPFGPSIALSAWFVMLFGTPILNWYLQFFI